MSALTLSPQALHDALRPLVGGRVRRATEGDAVAGVRPPVVVEPGGEEGVAAALAFADREGLKVLVRGGGTQLGLGFPPAGGDIPLSPAPLDRHVAPTPGDMTAPVPDALRLAAPKRSLGDARPSLAL